MTAPLKILVLDAEAGLCQELRGWLMQAGYDVVLRPEASGTPAGLSEIKPNLVILSLPNPTGEALSRYQRLTTSCQRSLLPLVVISNDPDLECEMLDVFDFQTTPVNRSRLLSCLNRFEESRGENTVKAQFGLDELAPFIDFLEEHSGLYFGLHNQRLLERGLMRRMQALCLADPLDYLAFLAVPAGNYDELNKLMGMLTVGETCFFRYPTHREAMVGQVFPQLLARAAQHRRLRIWSAGCSTGEEPYSLAIALLEYFPQIVDWDVQILATDINKRALRQAREGVYRSRALRQVDEELRCRYFRREGEHFVVAPQVRKLVRFTHLNLLEDLSPATTSDTADLDLIFCRNVLIYFRVATIRRIIDHFSTRLSPGGFLFLGHAETLQNISDRYLRVHRYGAFYYQRKLQSGAEFATSAVPPPAPPRPKSAQSAPGAPVCALEPSPQRPEELYAAATKAFEREEFAEAELLFDQLLVVSPEHSLALVGKGLIQANQGHFAPARRWCAQAIVHDDLCAAAYLLRGLILDMEDELERALVEYQKVLWLDRTFIMAHYLSSRVHHRLGQHKQAQRALRNTLLALEKSPVASVPFSGGLSRALLLATCHRELLATLDRD